MTTHGLTRSGRIHPLFHPWWQMIARCHNPSAEKYKWYGARGISVCERWRGNFANFVDDMAPRPKGMTLERRDNDGNYDPDNCYWATRSEQSRNRRSTVFIEHDGRRLCLREWSAVLGVGEWSVGRWMRAGYSMSDLFRLKAEGKFPMKIGQNRTSRKKS